MIRKCPLCRQPLPEAITDQDLRTRQQELTASAIAREERRLRKRLEDEFEQRFEKRAHAIERRAEREARRTYEEKLQQAEKNAAKRMEDRFKRQLAEMKSARDSAAKLAKKEAKAQLDSLKAAREKERARHDREQHHLRGQVDNLSRKLEQQTSQGFGEEGELDLLTLLQKAFPRDRIERVGKGVKGADILHYVMDGDAEAGRIVYECKNVATWQSAFVTKAKSYRTRYNTPYVFVATRAFPRKKKGMCVVNGIPIVDPALTSVMAGIVRDSILEIAQLRISKSSRVTRSQALFDYILSNDFQTKFREVADSVEDLHGLQVKERDWHENNWDKQIKLYNQIGSRRREIATQIGNLTGKKLRVKRASA